LGFFFDGGGEERNENENVATVERSKKKAKWDFIKCFAVPGSILVVFQQ